jgi:hypothetical protein
MGDWQTRLRLSLLSLVAKLPVSHEAWQHGRLVVKPPLSKTRLSDLKGKGKGKSSKTEAFAPPAPKVSRRKPGKVLTAEERQAFLAQRPDLQAKD